MTSDQPTEHTTFQGGCTCRQVRYQLTSAPMFVHCCHCTWCQRETGSAFVLNALIETERVHLLQGEIITIHTPSKSGKGQHIIRCPQCHVALWSHYALANKAIAFVRTGTLDHPELMPPDIHIYTSTRQPWVILPPQTPAVSAYYNTSKTWPEASLLRRAALRKKKAQE